MNIQRHESNTDEILIFAAASAIEQMKYKIARELGVTLGPDTSSRANAGVTNTKENIAENIDKKPFFKKYPLFL